MKKILSKLLALILAAMMIVPSYADDNKTVSRVAGSNRVDTSVKISQEAFISSEYAILATKDSYPDSLSGGQLALTIQAPILLTDKNKINDSVLNELNRLKVKKVFVMGGNSSVSDNVLESIKQFNPERLGGANRYETSKIIMEKTKEIGEAKGMKYTEMVIADGKNYPDALSANSYIMNKGALMVLSRGDKLPETDMSITVIGGHKSLPFVGREVKRIAGKDRYETSTLVAEKFNGNSSTVILASGESYPDALTSVGLMEKYGAPLVIVPSKNMKIGILGYLNKFRNAVIVGGFNSISKEIEQATIEGKLKKVQEPKKPQPKPQQNENVVVLNENVSIKIPKELSKYAVYKVNNTSNGKVIALYSKQHNQKNKEEGYMGSVELSTVDAEKDGMPSKTLGKIKKGGYVRYPSITTNSDLPISDSSSKSIKLYVNNRKNAQNVLVKSNIVIATGGAKYTKYR